MPKLRVRRYVDFAYWLLGKSYFLKSLSVIPIMLALSVMDLLAVGMLGLVTSLIVSPESFYSGEGQVFALLNNLGIQDWTLRELLIVLGSTSTVMLVLKSVSTMFISNWITQHFSVKAAQTSRQFVEMYLTQRLDRIRSNTAQKSIFSMTDGVQNLIVNVYAGVLILASDALLLTIYAIGIFIVDPLLSIVVLSFFTSMSIILTRKTSIEIRKSGSEAGRAKIASNQILQDLLGMHRELYSRGQINVFVDKFADERTKFAKIVSRMNLIGLRNKHYMEIVMVLAIFAIGTIVFTISNVQSALLTMAIFLGATARILPAIVRLQSGHLKIKSAYFQSIQAMDMLRGLRDGKIEVTREPRLNIRHSLRPILSNDFIPTISIDKLTFRYPESVDYLIQDLTVKIGPGVFFGVSGPSGIGKTTFLDLLLGLLEPSSGTVLISDMNPNMAMTMWSKKVAYVPQEIWLLSSTLRENLFLGESPNSAQEESALALLKEFELSDFTENYQGLDTVIGPGGLALSGGQRQKIGLIRALLAKPQLILLDESTSSLDYRSEQRILSKLKSLINSEPTLTILMVSHRVNSFRDADHILYFTGSGDHILGTFSEIESHPSGFTMS